LWYGILTVACCLTRDDRLVRSDIAPRADTRRQTGVAKVDAPITQRPAEASAEDLARAVPLSHRLEAGARG
jgi:hypothetical protein